MENPWKTLYLADNKLVGDDVLEVPGGVVLRHVEIGETGGFVALVYIPMVATVPAPNNKVTLISTFTGITKAVMEAGMEAGEEVERRLARKDRR
jgi:hypothetical protein